MSKRYKNKKIYSRPGVHTIPMHTEVRKVSMDLAKHYKRLERDGWGQEEINFIFLSAIQHIDCISSLFPDEDWHKIIKRERHGDAR